MKKAVRGIAWLMLLSLFPSCAGEPPADTDGPAVSDTEDTAGTVETEPLRATPEGTDFGSETVNILSWVSTSEMWLYDIESASGDVLNDAIYRQNRTTEENLNVTLAFENRDFKVDEFLTRVRTSVQAGDEDIDIVIARQYGTTRLIGDGAYRDLSESKYLDFSRPWWSGAYMENLNLSGDKVIYAAGDMTLSYLRWMTCCYFNKAVYESFWGDPMAMYQTVLDGEWTLDRVLEMTRDVWVDVSGDNKVDETDKLGYTLMTQAPTDSLYMNGGGQYIVRERDGTLVINPVTERTTKAMEKVCDIFWENPASCVVNPSTWTTFNTTIAGKFAADETLFLFGYFYTSDYLRNMESDYGIIPYPKCDTDMEDYRALIHNDVAVASIPVTVGAKFDAASAVLEELAYQGYRLTTPTYYDAVLKGKYMREEADIGSQMIDRIRASAFTDVGVVYADMLNNLGFFHRELLHAQSDALASMWGGWESAMQTKLDALLEIFEAEE